MHSIIGLIAAFHFSLIVATITQLREIENRSYAKEKSHDIDLDPTVEDARKLFYMSSTGSGIFLILGLVGIYFFPEKNS